jgi:hypothetical protein
MNHKGAFVVCDLPYGSGRCLEYLGTNHSIVLREHRCTYKAHNPEKNTLARYRVDGCLLTTGIRCDYVIINANKRTVYFIELKGVDLVHGVRQIAESISQLGAQVSSYNSINARIVLRRVQAPDLKSVEIIKLERRLRKRNGTFLKQARCIEENV